MLNIFKRNRRPAPSPINAEPLRIRNLLDDPRLQAVMNTDGPAVVSSVPLPGRTHHELVLGTAA